VSTLTTAAGNSQVIMAGGATSHNVFWQIGSSATLGTNTTFAGTIMASQSISLSSGVTLNGRALASIGAVTLISDTVNVPSCP
jgi:type VI secretion system secreted protein VgrG